MAINLGNIKGQGDFLLTPTNVWKPFLSAQTETSAAALDLTAIATYNTISKAITDHTANDGGQLFDVPLAFGKSANGVTISFYSRGDSADDTFGFDLYAIRDATYSDQSSNTNVGDNKTGPLIPVYITAITDCKVGTMTIGYDPDGDDYDATTLAVDTIDGTDTWPTGVTINDSGNNRLCQMHFDLMGCRYLYLNTFGLGAGGTEAASIGALISAW